MSKRIAGSTMTALEHCYALQAAIGLMLSTSFPFWSLQDLTSVRTKEKLRSGEITVSGDEWPIFLYRGYTYDPEDPWNGLFRSDLLVSVSASQKMRMTIPLTFLGIQVYFYISELRWKGAQGDPIRQRSHPRDDPGHTRFHCIHCHSGKECTSCTTQCLCAENELQVRFALSSPSVFSRTDTVTDSETFYNTVLDLFHDVDEKAEVDDLLTWWNRCVLQRSGQSWRR